MRLPRDKDVLENARALRKSMTREERHLWYDFLRGYSPRFVRQKVVGRYILDFYCDAAGLAIELDGSQHYEAAGQGRWPKAGGVAGSRPMNGVPPGPSPGAAAPPSPKGGLKFIERGLVNLCQP